MHTRPSLLSGHVARTLASLILIGLVALLPDLTPRAADPDAEVVTAFRGRIESIDITGPGLGEGGPTVPVAQVRALDGPRAGDIFAAYLTGPGGSQTVADYRAGEEVVVTIAQSPDGGDPFVSVSDRWRMPSLVGVGLLFAAAVVVVGGWHGVRALVALGLTIAVILKILLPLVIGGVAPVPLAVAAASAITVASIVLTEGWKRSSLAGILGTTASLASIGLLAAAATSAMGFNYSAGSDLAFLATQGGQGLDLRGILLAAFILGAVGVLDDVTVTQAVLVEELADKGGLRGANLFWSAMRVGRSHIAATVNTLFLAYVGAGLPLLVVLLVSRQPSALVLNSEIIATEIVRTLVGSLGIVAAVPLTTFVAVSLASGLPTGLPGGRHGRAPLPPGVVVVAVVVLGLLAATALLPLTIGRRPALTESVFDPGASLPLPSPSAEPARSDGPGIVGRGDTVPITIDGTEVGSITVLNWRRGGSSAGSQTHQIEVDVRYAATAPFPLDIGRWEIVLADGGSIPLVPGAGPNVLGQPLAAGDATDITFVGDIPVGESEPLLVFVDVATSVFVMALVLE